MRKKNRWIWEISLQRSKGPMIRQHKSLSDREENERCISQTRSPTGDSHPPIPMCTICGERLCNGSMKPSKLINLLDTKHPAFKKLFAVFWKKPVMSETITEDLHVNRASYLVANCMTKTSFNIHVCWWQCYESAPSPVDEWSPVCKSMVMTVENRLGTTGL